jgi:hypothetical protein
MPADFKAGKVHFKGREYNGLSMVPGAGLEPA